jgi:hypothetical protein
MNGHITEATADKTIMKTTNGVMKDGKMVVENQIFRERDHLSANLHSICSDAAFAYRTGRLYFICVVFGLPWIFAGGILNSFRTSKKRAFTENNCCSVTRVLFISHEPQKRYWTKNSRM